MDRITPVLMVKNEANWIQAVLRPLVAVFGHALLGDTGSTDGTAELAEEIPGVEVLRLGPLSARELGQTRRKLGRHARQNIGSDWIMQVDGDELYHPEALAYLAQQEIPAGKQAGFTTLVSLDADQDGQLWEMEDIFARLAILPADVAWTGDYPFEVPVVFEHPPLFWYADLPESWRYHGVHLHRLERSPQDDAVMLRRDKRFQFSMVDRIVRRTRPWDREGWML